LLVAHGSPARDLPRELLRELRQLNAKPDRSAADEARAQELEHTVRHWPRTGDNDPYRAGTEELVAELRLLMGDVPVLAAYNEFCAPSIVDAVEQLCRSGVTHVDVFSTMMTPGGGHSEHDVPEALATCRQRFPGVELQYRWPYQLARVAKLLKDHL
jgi:sirohydrochlorin cobaltochelatase